MRGNERRSSCYSVTWTRNSDFIISLTFYQFWRRDLPLGKLYSLLDDTKACRLYLAIDVSLHVHQPCLSKRMNITSIYDVTDVRWCASEGMTQHGHKPLKWPFIHYPWPKLSLYLRILIFWDFWQERATPNSTANMPAMVIIAPGNRLFLSSDSQLIDTLKISIYLNNPYF